MLASPQCTLGGELLAANVTPISAVYCDPSGGLWAIHASGMCVFYFSASAVADIISSTSSSSSASFSGVAAIGAKLKAPSAPIFECSEEDQILAVVFPTTRNASRLFACIATTEGRLVLVDTEEPVNVLRQCDIGTLFTAVTPAPMDAAGEAAEDGAGVLVSSFDGTFSEVVFVHWEGDDKAVVSATGLFRIRGNIHNVILDEASKRILTITQHGEVDVWNWRKGFDETLSFGMLAYSIDDYGEPSCSILLSGGFLWIGTMMGYIVVFHLRPGVSDGSPRHVWQAHSNAVAIRSLLLMSLGRHIWSYAADRQALVWDAETWTLQGSFQFPGDGFSKLHGGLRCMDTIAWGIDETAGTVTWFTVKEPFLRADCGLSFGRDECVMPRGEVERLHLLETLVSHLCSQLLHAASSDEGTAVRERSSSLNDEHTTKNGVKEEEEEQNMATPPHIDLALQQLDEDHPSARLLPPAVASLVVGWRMVRRTLADAGMRSRSFLEDVQVLLQDNRRHKELQAQVRRCLAELRQELQHGDVCDTLDDVVDIFRALVRRVEEDSPAASPAHSAIDRNRQTSSRTHSGSTDDAIKTVPSLVEASDDVRARRLEEDLMHERQRRERSEMQLTEAYDEKRELQRQLTQSMRLQEDYEERLLSLERSLKTAKKAAAVTATEAARFSEMEANLNEAHHTIHLLQDKLEGLMRERQESLQTAQENKSLHAEVQNFQVKEQVARRALASFIETQDFMLDKLSDVLQHTNTDVELYSEVSSLYETFCSRVEMQHGFLVELKRGYARQRDKDT
ncbi:hypothetical protein TCSYLVIO_007250 [Trypanosoma cruzi]|nr:hypothetical protein TCSYLVIO_007250 [Trypanosoma cruzi]